MARVLLGRGFQSARSVLYMYIPPSEEGSDSIEVISTEIVVEGTGPLMSETGVPVRGTSVVFPTGELSQGRIAYKGYTGLGGTGSRNVVGEHVGIFCLNDKAFESRDKAGMLVAVQRWLLEQPVST